jgi:3-oxoacyl-[acyl-carrier-protein] synthase II
MQPTAITGIGLITPVGQDKQQWFAGLCKGRRLPRPFAEDSSASDRNRIAFCIDGFDPSALLPTKGLQYFGRTHLLAAAAAQLAMTDCGLPTHGFDPTHLGVVMAMTFGTLQNISGFYEQALAHGPAAVSPVKFANTVANSPASRTAILLGAKGLNATLAHGENAGLEAIAFSAGQLAQGPERLILAGSGYGLCCDMMRAYEARGLLGPAKATAEKAASIPLDMNAHGMVLGEAAAVLALETPENARVRGARIYGYVTGHAQGFSPEWPTVPDETTDRITATMRRALQKAGLSPDQIGWVAAAASGHPGLDTVEARAIRKVFGNVGAVRVTALKSMNGECFDVIGPLSVAAALLSMDKGAIPPTAGIKHPLAELPEGCILDRAENKTVRHVLVNALALSGGCSSMVVSSQERESQVYRKDYTEFDNGPKLAI